MQDSASQGSLVRQRQIHIGRLHLDLAVAECRLVHGAGRDASLRDQSYLLIVPLTKPVAYGQSGRSGVISAGEYVLLSQMEFYELTCEADAPLLMLRLPAGELRGRLTSIDDHIGRRFGANAQMARLLVGLLRSVADVFADCAPPNPEALATEIFGFITLAIGAEDRGSALDVRNARYRLRRRIFDFIDSNLGDQDLSPKKIAANIRISPSYLYSLFNDDDTTVGQFLQVKRLQRAYELLVADPKGHLTIAEIAYQVGFKNVSHFSRSFSRHFGMPPRNARPPVRSAAGPLAAGADEMRLAFPAGGRGIAPERLHDAG